LDILTIVDDDHMYVTFRQNSKLNKMWPKKRLTPYFSTIQVIKNEQGEFVIAAKGKYFKNILLGVKKCNLKSNKNQEQLCLFPTIPIAYLEPRYIVGLLSWEKWQSGSKTKEPKKFSVQVFNPKKNKEVILNLKATKFRSIYNDKNYRDIEASENAHVVEISQMEYQRLYDEIEEIKTNKHIKNYIVDLRLNGGGSDQRIQELVAALSGSDSLVPFNVTNILAKNLLLNKLILHKPRYRNKTISPKVPFKETKVLVLIDLGTASAAEDLASAIQQSGNTILIGTNTADMHRHGNMFNLFKFESIPLTVLFGSFEQKLLNKQIDENLPLIPDYWLTSKPTKEIFNLLFEHFNKLKNKNTNHSKEPKK